MSTGQNKNQTPRESLWTKDFILVCIAGFLANISIQMMNTTLAPFANDLWNSKTLGGLLTTFFNIGSIGMAFVSGAIANRTGRRNALIISAAIFVPATLMMALLQVPGVCLAMRILQGTSKGLTFAVASVVVTEVSPQSRLTEALGLFGLGSTLAFAIGPYIGLVMSDVAYTSMFLVCAAMSVLGGFSALFITYEKHYKARIAKETAGLQAAAPKKEYHGAWKLVEKKALASGINFAIAFASTSCILIFISTFSKEVLGYTSYQTCGFYVVAAIAMLIIRLFGGRIADTYGPLTMVIPGHAAIFILLLTMATSLVTRSYAFYLLCGACYGFAIAANMPAMNAMAVLYSPADRKSEANASFAFVQDIGIMIASLTFGSVIDAGKTVMQGYRMVFIICLVVAAISFAMSLILYNKKAVARYVAARED